jgi:hypothetical protein
MIPPGLSQLPIKQNWLAKKLSKSKQFYYLCLKWPPVDKLQSFATNNKKA